MRDQIAPLLSACLATLMCSGPAFAQAESPGAGQAIDLPEAITRTLASNPYLTASGFDISVAEGRLLQAELAPRPELSVVLEDALGTDSFRGTRRADATVTLGWILERGLRQRRVSVGRAGVAVSTVDVEIVRLDAAAETARRFLDCLAYQARLLNAEEAMRLAQAAVAAVRRRAAASLATEAELARAEAELVRAQLRYEDYEHELLSAYHRLSAQWGETEPDFASVAGSLESLPALEPFDALLARVDANPDVARFVSQSRLDEAALELARAQSRPNWRVSAGLRRIETSDDFALVGSVSVPLRLGNRNQGAIAEARANLARTQIEATAAQVGIETELFVLYQALQHDIQLPERLQADVVPRFEGALAATQRAFELGRSSYLELRTVQTELLEVNNDLLEAHIDVHRLIIEIERLTGERFASPRPTQ